MAPPPDSPHTKHKKKKKNKVNRRGDEERTRGDEERTRGDEERTRGDEERTRGDEERTRGDEERTRGDEERTRGDEEGTRGDEEGTRGDEAGTRGDEAGTRGDEAGTRGDEARTRGDEARTRGDEERTQGDEERTRGDEERTQGSKGIKKKRSKKRAHEQMMESEDTRAEEEGKQRAQGDEEVKTKKKNGTQPRGNQPRAKKTRRKQKGAPSLQDVSESEQDAEVSHSDLLELEHFIPDIRRKSLDVKQRLIRYDLPRFREFKQKGLKLRWGKFSQAETLQLRRNVADFLKLTGIESVEELFYPQRYPERSLHLRNLKARHHFYRFIADGLMRTCEQVYICCRKMYDSRNHKGRFSEAELTALDNLQAIYGNDWKTIGNKLERSIYACQKRFTYRAITRGPWADEEVERLKKAAKKHLKRVLKSSPDPDTGPSFVQLCSRLPWVKIESKVKTRSWVQCRVKWFCYLRSRLKAIEPRMIHGASIETRIRLIQALNQLQVEDVSDVDWIELAKTVGGVTPMCMQRLFHRMKVSRIPNWTHRPFGEIVDFLFEQELPRLQNKLNYVPVYQPGPAQFSMDQLFPKELEDFGELDNS